MLRNPSNSVVRRHLPTVADLQRRRAEHLGLPRPSQSGHHTESLSPDLYTPQSAHLNSDPAAESRPASPPIPSATPSLGEAALHGLAGLVLSTIAPHTEAHPAALLLQFLAVYGNLLGPGPHCTVDATRHALNLYVVLVGDSGKARKGTSWSQVARLFAEVDQPWLSTRVTTARLTATALHQTLRHHPQADRRLLALSEEFAPLLHSLKRGNGGLSPLLRSAWDSGHLPAPDSQHPQAPPTHFSLIAHITERELAQNLPRTEVHNGFANRCLWAWVERSNCLPEGGNLGAGELSVIARELRGALDWAASMPEILFRRDHAARELWHDCYPSLSQLRSGLRGAATSRAEAQVLRLSAIYAALDSSSSIGQTHLEAAFAVWDYCYASASLLFGMSTGDPIADRIREAIEASHTGLSKNQIRRLFHGHVESHRIQAALEKLVDLDTVAPRTEPTTGRPSTLWLATGNNQHQEIEEPGEKEPVEDR